jgi:hypothetical protein
MHLAQERLGITDDGSVAVDNGAADNLLLDGRRQLSNYRPISDGGGDDGGGRRNDVDGDESAGTGHYRQSPTPYILQPHTLNHKFGTLDFEP